MEICSSDINVVLFFNFIVDLAPSQMSGLSQDAVDTRFPLPVMAAHEELSSC